MNVDALRNQVKINTLERGRSEEEVRDLLKAERRRKWRQRSAIIVAQIAIGGVFLVLWQVLSGVYLDPFWFSAPLDIFKALKNWFASGSIWPHIWNTLYKMMAGFVVASVAAILLGFVLGQTKFVAKILEPYIMMLFSLPKIALGPLFIIWFGLGFKSSFMMVIAMVFFPVFYNVLNGVRAVDKSLIQLSRIMGANRWQLAQKIILPATKPWIFTGLKLAVPFAIIGAVVGEMLGANRGLGFLVQYHSGQFDSTGVFAALIVLTVIAVLLDVGSKNAGKLLRVFQFKK